MRHPFLRTLAGSAATPTDPNFENVTLLLHGDGTNGGQNNTFVDGSTNNFTITRNGNTTQGTFSPYGDNWSNYFDTTNTSLVATGTTSTGNFPTSTDFTIEFWWRSKLVNSGTGIVVAKTQWASTSADSWWMEVNGSYKVAFVGHSGTSTFTPVTSTTSVMDGLWHHCAVSRTGTTYRVFVDGALEQTTTNSTTMNQGSRNVTFAGITTIGGLNYGATGYISNLRIVVGTCLYTAAFTPSTAPLTSVTNTVLLTCQSNRFKDNGPNNYTISRQQGTPSVQRFSPFSPTAAYAAGTNGGSGYFDGSGDSLTVADDAVFDLGNGAFTIEAWVYLNGNNNYGLIIGQWGAANNNAYVLRQAGTTYYPELVYTTNGTTEVVAVVGSTALPLRRWVHVAAARNGSSTISLFVDGSRVATNSSFTATIFNSTANVRVGGEASGSNSNGYICDARVVKGTAVYDPTQTTLTVPAAPLTAITNTSLLLNFTNAAILDNAMMAVPETVGNAQIDTTTKKYGTGSLYFDGNGDRLTLPDNANFSFGTGDFTVEAWVNIDSTVNPARPDNLKTITVFSTGSSGSNDCSFAIYGNTTTPGIGLELYQASPAPGALTVAATVTPNTWVHIAFVRTGTTFYGFVNGTRYTMGTSSVAIASSVAPKIGAANTPNYTNQFKGYIDDLRITKGVARYTANFTAPTAAFPDL